MKSYLAEHDEIATDHFDTEAFIVNFRNGRYYGLRGSGAVIWNLLKSPQTTKSIVERLARNFGNLPSDAASDVSSFLDRLVAEGLALQTETSPATENHVLGVVADQTYQSPVIEVFDDLTELVGIDPLHEVDEERGWPVTPTK